jgi:sulfite exporter TauE/SafE
MGMPELSLLSAALVGLLSGVHCVGMCGGLVSAFSLQLPGKRPRLSYHLAANAGRIASYTVAGLLAGAVGGESLFLSRLFPVEKVLYALANVMLIALGFYLAGFAQQAVRFVERWGGGLVWQRLAPILARLLPIQSLPQAFAAGLIWGWLPCGLVYSVLVTALASADPLSGAATMLAFGLGTVPNLLAMGWFANGLARAVQRRFLRLAAGLLVAGYGVTGLIRLVL